MIELKPPSQDAALVRVTNPTPYARTGLARVTLPWREGAYRGEPLAAAHTTPFGARWLDGSWRYSIAEWIQTLAPAQTLEVRLFRGAVEPKPWEFGAGVRAFKLPFSVGEVTVDLMASTGWELLAATEDLRRYRTRTRVPDTPIIAELWLETFRGLDFAHGVLRYFDSDPSDPDINHDLGEVTLGSDLPLAVWMPNKVVERQGDKVTLCRAGTWHDGVGQRVRFSIGFPHPDAHADSLRAETIAPITATAMGWGPSKAFSPWGVLPDPPEAVTDEVAWRLATESWREHWQVPPFVGPWEQAFPFGSAANPNMAGDQPNFGCLAMLLELHGWPHRVFSVLRSVDQADCRWSHIRDEEGAPVRFQAEDVELWECRPDRRINPLPLLGKENPGTPPVVDPGQNSYAPSHFFPAHELYAAMITGDPVLLDEVDHLAECFLGMIKGADARSVALKSIGSSRGEGRSLHTGVLLWMLTGRSDVLARCVERVDDVIAPNWHGAREEGWQRWLSVADPHPNHFGAEVRYVDSWMEAMAVRGLDALYQVTGHVGARDIAGDIARTILDTSFVEQPGGQWEGVAALEYRTGNEEQSELRQEVGGIGLHWFAPAVIVARQYALAAATDDDERVIKADSILTQLRATATWETLEWLAMD